MRSVTSINLMRRMYYMLKSKHFTHVFLLSGSFDPFLIKYFKIGLHLFVLSCAPDSLVVQLIMKIALIVAET